MKAADIAGHDVFRAFYSIPQLPTVRNCSACLLLGVFMFLALFFEFGFELINPVNEISNDLSQVITHRNHLR